jgi:hypothetical protein
MHGRRCCWAFACNPQLDLQKQCEAGRLRLQPQRSAKRALQAASTSIVITIKMTLAKCPWVHVLKSSNMKRHTANVASPRCQKRSTVSGSRRRSARLRIGPLCNTATPHTDAGVRLIPRLPPGRSPLRPCCPATPHTDAGVRRFHGCWGRSPPTLLSGDASTQTQSVRLIRGAGAGFACEPAVRRRFHGHLLIEREQTARDVKLDILNAQIRLLQLQRTTTFEI